MVAALAGRWWAFLVQGIAMLAIAVLVFVQPQALIFLIGAYALIDGILKLISAFSDRSGDQNRWATLLLAVVSILAGLVIIANPAVSAGWLTSIIALWAILVGILVLVWAFRVRKEVENEWLMVLFGILSIIFGVVVLANIQEGALALRSIFVIYMIAGGILAIALAFRIKSIGERLGLIS
jgi:uncharacterized membrane protein HdeD (DUF308 family)